MEMRFGDLRKTNIWLQIGLITIAMLLGLFATLTIINFILIRAAITEEAAYVWEKVRDGDLQPLPDTKNLRAVLLHHPDFEHARDDFIHDPGRILLQGNTLQKLTELPAGFSNYEGNDAFNFVLVEDNYQRRLVLFFNAANVRSLVTLFGVVPLAIALLFIYTFTYIAYRQIQRYASPFSELARRLRGINFSSSAPGSFNLSDIRQHPNEDVQILVGALDSVNERLAQFVEREKNFTRDASHEIRTPITVIRMAIDMLKSQENLNQAQQKGIQRIERASLDIEELIAVLLTLSREQDKVLPHKQFSIVELIEKEVQRCKDLYAGKPIEIALKVKSDLTIKSSDVALKILIGNLLRNACNYTDHGSVLVEVNACIITIADTGRGMTSGEIAQLYTPYARGSDLSVSGYGIGLSIVRRLAESFGWRLHVQSSEGQGSCFTLTLAAK